MNMKADAVNFTGKKEVLYGLNRAAQKAKMSELYNQPAVASRLQTTQPLVKAANDAYMRAYLEMVLNDEAFVDTVQKIKASELYSLHEALKPQQTQHSTIWPINSFKQAMIDTVKNLGRVKISVKDAVNDLYKKLEL